MGRTARGMRFQLPADVPVVLVLQRHKYPDGLIQWVLQDRFSIRLRIYLRLIDDWLTRVMPRSGPCAPGACTCPDPAHGG